MLLQFRQGLVQVQAPMFFKVTFPYVDLMVTDTNTIVSFAAGTKDYLYTEQESVTQAWGPLTLGRDQWLYWDLDTRTGRRSFGITLHEPVTSHVAPTSPVTDQHWFDLSTGNMCVWSGHGWLKRIRTFAVKLSNGKVPVSMSINAPLYTGTQIGVTTSTYAGHIMFDATTNNAIRDSSGMFVTSEDQLSTKSISLSEVKLASIIIEGEAQQNMAAHTVVVFSEFGKIVHADQFTAEQTRHFGMIESSAVVGQTVPVTNHGMISSASWDWSAAGVNALVYCDASGALTTTPVIPNQIPIGEVLDRHTIILGSPIVQAAGGADVALATQEVFGISRLSVPAEDAGDPIVVGDNDPRLSNARPPAFHMHPIAQVIDLQDTLDGKVNKAGDTMTGYLELSADPILGIQAATKHYVDNRIVRLSDLVNSDRSNFVQSGTFKQTWAWTIPGNSVSWMDDGLVLKSTYGATSSGSYGSFSAQGNNHGIYSFNMYWDPNGAYDYDIQPVVDNPANNAIILSNTDPALTTLYACRSAWFYGDIAPANNPGGIIPTGTGTAITSGFVFIHNPDGYTGSKTMNMASPYPTELTSRQANVVFELMPIATDGVSIGGTIGIRVGSDFGGFNGVPIAVDFGAQTIDIGGSIVPFDADYNVSAGTVYTLVIDVGNLDYAGTSVVDVHASIYQTNPPDGVSDFTTILQNGATPFDVPQNSTQNKHLSYISTFITDDNGSSIAIRNINVNSSHQLAVDYRPSLLTTRAEVASAHSFKAMGVFGNGLTVQATGRTMLGGGTVPCDSGNGAVELTDRDDVTITALIDGASLSNFSADLQMDPFVNTTTTSSGNAIGGTVRLRGGAATYAEVSNYTEGNSISVNDMTADGAQIDLTGAGNANLPASPGNPGPVGGSAIIRGGDAKAQHENAYGGNVTIRGGIGFAAGYAGTVLIQSGRPQSDYTLQVNGGALSDICTSAHFTETAIHFYTTLTPGYEGISPIVSIESNGFTFGMPSDWGHAGTAGQAILHDGNKMYWGDVAGGGGGSAQLQTLNIGTPYFPA